MSILFLRVTLLKLYLVGCMLNKETSLFFGYHLWTESLAFHTDSYICMQHGFNQVQTKKQNQSYKMDDSSHHR